MNYVHSPTINDGLGGDHAAWWEDVPLSQSAQPLGMSVSPGDNVYAGVFEQPKYYRVGPGGVIGPVQGGANVNFFVEDLTTGTSKSAWIEDDTTIQGLPTAEWIVERPLQLNPASGTARFAAFPGFQSGDFQWTETMAGNLGPGGGDSTAAAATGEHNTMKNSTGTILADPRVTGFTGPSGTQFAVHWSAGC